VSIHRIGRIGSIFAIAWSALACAPIPRPTILAEVDQIGQGAAAAEARTHAPGALAHAEKLRKDAGAAFAAGDTAAAQILGEQALAAYAHAHALARIARAETATDEAEARLATAKKELAGFDTDQAAVSAEADALELKIRVARDAQPIQPSGKTDPERERARIAAARALTLQARLLCAGARLLTAGSSAAPGGAAPALDPKLTAQLDEATAALSKLEADLGPAATVAPIDAATRARAGCLAALTAIRRAGTPVSRAPGAGDALLAEISAMGSLAPSRDDRGVYITLRGIFKEAGSSAALTPLGEARLTEIGRIAAAHPTFPALVIVHKDKALNPREEPIERARAEALTKSIAAAAKGAKVEAIVAGNAAPVVDPAGADRTRNTRVEIVFVTPESF
jgi:hypothetical protein